MQVTDPVCKMVIENEEAAGREIWKGEDFYFCSRSCHERFRAAPDRYVKQTGDADHGPPRG